MRRFVVVVDMQHDFVAEQGALPVPGASALREPMSKWLGALDPARTAGVLFTFDTHAADTYPASAEAASFPIHCVRGGAGWQSVFGPDAVPAGIPVFRLEKPVFDMWADPGSQVEGPGRDRPVPRDAFFEALRRDGVGDVAVVGVAADYCVRFAISGLVARGFAVTVPAGLTRGIAREIDEVAATDFQGADVRLELAA